MAVPNRGFREGGSRWEEWAFGTLEAVFVIFFDSLGGVSRRAALMAAGHRVVVLYIYKKGRNRNFPYKMSIL